jgi:hypothetical protein
MSKLTLTVAALSVAALGTFSAPAAWAASPSERECEASGGTFGRERGEVSCTRSDTKDVPGNAFGTRTTTTTTGQGNAGNKPAEEPCTGNQGQCMQQERQ